MSSPIIQIKNLSIELSGNPILNAIALDVLDGDYVSIIGPNGAGKTTLIKCMAGIHRNWTGSIEVRGRSFRNHGPRALARIQSYVPQAEGRGNPLTVEEFAAMGRYPHLSAFTTLNPADYNAVDQALHRCGLTSFRHRKLNTLSGGERQMAFIAAALAQEPQILLLDEPATFLDYQHQAKVASILKSAGRDSGQTVVAVHHDINTAMLSSSRIVAIKNGTVVFNGTPQEIADAVILEEIYKTPFDLIPSPHRPLPLVAAGGPQ